MLTHDQYRELAKILVMEAINAISDEGKIPGTRAEFDAIVASAMSDFDVSSADWMRRANKS